MNDKDWKIFQGTPQSPHDGIDNLPESPSWRPFGQNSKPGESRRKHRGETFNAREDELNLVNAALFLRRPLLITGPPGVGKSSLVYAVAQELKLGEVLYWPITSRTILKDGLYSYDAIGRLQEAKENENLTAEEKQKRIGKYISLGPLGTALLPSKRPRVLLIDEIDKSDIDLPNDLLTIFEEGRFEIPELVRITKEIKEPISVRTAYIDETEPTWNKDGTYAIEQGRVLCQAFPFVVLTSNGERDFPPPFLRRCLRLDMKRPEKADLERIVAAHFEQEFTPKKDADGQVINDQGAKLKASEIEQLDKMLTDAKKKFDTERDSLIKQFLEKRETGILSTDQLLNAIFLVTREQFTASSTDPTKLAKHILRSLSSGPEDSEDDDLEENDE